jgi:chemotaxis signal transduction protein
MVFRLGEERFALMLSEVSELFRDARIAAVPGAPPEIAGVTQVRGEIYPVFEAAVLLGVARPEQDDTVVLVRHVQRQLGLRIGLVEDIRPLRAARDNEVPQDPRIRQYSEDLIQVVNLEYVLGQVGAK